MSKKANDPLIKAIDDAVSNLLAFVDPSVGLSDGGHPSSETTLGAGVIDFSDRVKAIELGVKWLATKNKIDFEDDGDEFSRLRQGHIGGHPRKRGSSLASARTNGSA